MLERLSRRLRGRGMESEQDRFEPIYGYPRAAVEQWLARNPELKRRYEKLLKDRALRQSRALA
jgi:hypothetical protein